VLGYAIAGIANERGDRGLSHDIVAQIDLVAMPGFLRPGTFSVDFDQGNFTSMRLRASVGAGGLDDVDLGIFASLVGRYEQSFDGAPDALRGDASLIAASMDFRYVDRWLLGRRDLFAIAHLVGPRAELWHGFGGGWFAHARGDVHLDFTGMGSPAYQRWIATYGPGGTKSVLAMHEYYLGVGGSGRLEASLGFRSIALEGRAAYGAYRSVDGMDQNQTDVLHDDTNTDQILELGAGIAASPQRVPVVVRVGWDQMRHRSQMGPFAADWTDQRVAAGAALRF
jgi:hypothetical protein